MADTCSHNQNIDTTIRDIVLVVILLVLLFMAREWFGWFTKTDDIYRRLTNAGF